MSSSRFGHIKLPVKMGLRNKLMALIGIPIVVQLILTIVLWSIRTTADTRAVNLGRARESAAATGIVIMDALAIIGYSHESFRKGLLVEYNYEKEMSQLKIWSAWIQQNSPSPEFGQTAKTIAVKSEKLAIFIRQTCRYNFRVLVEEQKQHHEQKFAGMDLARSVAKSPAASSAPVATPSATSATAPTSATSATAVTAVTATANPEATKRILPKQLQPKVSQMEIQIEQDLRKLQDEQTQYSRQRTQEAVAPQQDILFAAAVLGVFLNLIALVTFGFIFSRNIIARLSAVRENVAQIERRGKLFPSLGGTDEIAQLDRIFHDMAAMLDQAEEKERALFEQSHNVLCSIDIGRKFLEVNQASMKALGYEPREMIGKRVENFVPPSERVKVRQLLETALIEQLQSSFELTMLRRDGASLQTIWTTSATPDREKIFCVLHDISERKAAQRLRKEMVQMVTHDLRSPLNSLGVVYAMLRDNRFGELNEKGRRFLQAAESNASRMLRLINDLLDIEKLEAGMVQLEKAPTRLSTLIDQALDSVLPLANQKQINLSNGTPGDALVVNIDPHRIMQVLINLLSNAIKFSPPGGAITVGLYRTDRYVEIGVADRGRGIPSHLLKDVFKRFQQVERSDATEKGGSGLGLAICKSLVDLHGGSMSVQSEEGKGSVFIVRLPI